MDGRGRARQEVVAEGVTVPESSPAASYSARLSAPAGPLARWSSDAVGLVLVDLIVAHLLPVGSPLTVGVAPDSGHGVVD